ncbi:hypothetical protein [Asticcacaulis taihuensis]|uniref:hypothetical protein n=1 Tax=Asticcacaulis taihuensis TaxID=260084 RepID=UPI0026F306A8|nr:hypothetical protein [Asticcacaulis taihuensis]
MSLRIPSERTRSPLARNLYRLQVATVILGTGVYALLLVEPGHHLVRVFISLFTALFNAILR